MTALLLASCTWLSAVVVDPSNLSNPYAGDPPCSPGPWTVECPACEPPIRVTALGSCVEDGDGSEDALDLLPGGFAAWAIENPSADLRVCKESTP